MGTVSSKKVDDVLTEPRKAFSDDDIFRHSKRASKSAKHQSYFSNQPLRPKSGKSKPQQSESTSKSAKDIDTNRSFSSTSKGSFWNKRSKRERNANHFANSRPDVGDSSDPVKTDYKSEPEADSDPTESVNFRKLNRFQSNDESGPTWSDDDGLNRNRIQIDSKRDETEDEEWTKASLHRSYDDCLNANTMPYLDPYLSKSFNPLVSSKLPFMLSFELKPSLVAQLNSFKSPARDKLGVGARKRNDVVTEVNRQISAPESLLPDSRYSVNSASQSIRTSTLAAADGDVDSRNRVDVSRYMINSKAATLNGRANQSDLKKFEYKTGCDKIVTSNHLRVDIPVDNGRRAHHLLSSQDDSSYKEITNTLAKLVNKAGSHEYRKFCNLARAYSVDFSDIYIADFLESVETLAKLAKPLPSPTPTPAPSPFKKPDQSSKAISNTKQIRTTVISPKVSSHEHQPSLSGARRSVDYSLANTTTTTATVRPEMSADSSSANTDAAPLTAPCAKKVSRIPIPIGTKMINRTQKDQLVVPTTTAAAATATATTRTGKNGYSIGQTATIYKQLLSGQQSIVAGELLKETLSSIEEDLELSESNKEQLDQNSNRLLRLPNESATQLATQSATHSANQSADATTTTARPPSKCCCFCEEESLSPVDRMESEILIGRKDDPTATSTSPDPGSRFDVDFYYVDKDTKKPTVSFEEVLQMKRNKRLIQIQDETLPPCSTRPATATATKTSRPPPGGCGAGDGGYAARASRKRSRHVSLCLLGDSSDRYVPVARLTIRRRCTCEAQIRRLCSFLENPGCCLAEATLAECLLEPSAMLRLSKALEINESLRILNLESCQLGDDGAMFFGAALKHNATLVRLGVSKNLIGPKGIAYLAKCLSKNNTLQELNLDYNVISDSGCKIIADLLSGRKTECTLPASNDDIIKKVGSFNANSQETLKTADSFSKENDSAGGGTVKTWLKKLSLKANRVSSEGATNMFLVLRHCSSLTELDLSGNHLGDDCISALSGSLLFNRSLKCLRLDNCGLSWKSCELIRRPLRTNTDLAVLSLDLNQLTDTGVAHLADGLQYNRTLRELSLNMCGVTSLGLESLVGVIKSRTALRTLRLCYNDIAIAENSSTESNLASSNRSESNEFLDKRESSSWRASQALLALDKCLRESQKNLVDDFGLAAAYEDFDDDSPRATLSRISAPVASRHQGVSKNSLNSSLYRKMMMALKRNPSLRIVMWGNQQQQQQQPIDG